MVCALKIKKKHMMAIKQPYWALMKFLKYMSENVCIDQNSMKKY